MSKRQQVELGLDAPTLQPAAEPVNVYYRPALPAPLLKPIIDLSPLSEVAAKIAHEQRQIQAARDKEAGKSLVTKNRSAMQAALSGIDELAPGAGAQVAAAMAGPGGAAVASAAQEAASQNRATNQDAWSRLVSKGLVPEGASPWTRVGALEAAAQDLMDRYGRELKGRLDEVSKQLDANGVPTMPADPQRVIAQTWAKYEKNPVFQDFYAQRVLNDLKPQIDSGFEGEAAAQLGKNQAEFRYQNVTQQLAGKLNDLAVSGKPWGPDAYAQLGTFQNEQMRRRSMKEVHQSTLDAIETVAANEAAIDPNLAASFLDNAMDIPSGTTTMGKDTRSAERLRELKQRYLAEAETKDHRGRADRAQVREDTIRTSVDSALNAMSEAIKNGANPIDAGNSELARIRKEGVRAGDADLTGTVASAIEQLVQNRANASAPGLSDQISARIESGDTAGLDAQMQEMLKTGALSWKDYSAQKATLAKRRDVTSVVEENPVYVRGLSDISALVPQDLPVEVRGPIQDRVEQDRRKYTSALAEYAQNLGGSDAEKAVEIRKWSEKWISDLTATRTAESASLRSSRDAAVAVIEQKHARHEDAAAEVEAAQKAGFLSRSEANGYLATSSGLAGGAWFMGRPEYTQALTTVQYKAQAAAEAFGKISDAPGQFADLLSFAQSELQSRYAARLSTDLKDVPIAQIPSRSREILGEVVDKVTKSLGDTARDRAKSLMSGGKPIGEAVTAAQDEPTGNKDALANSVKTQVAALGLDGYRQYLNLGRHAAVDPAVYKDLEGLTLKTWFHTRRPGVEDAVWAESQRIAKTNLPPEEVSAALHSMAKDLVVPWREAAAGMLVIRPSDVRIDYSTPGIPEALAEVGSEAVKAGLVPGATNNWKYTASWGAWHPTVSEIARIKGGALPGSDLQKALDKYQNLHDSAAKAQQVSIPLDKTKIDASLTPFFRTRAELREFYGSGKTVPAAAATLLGSLGRPTTLASLDSFVNDQAAAIDRTNPDSDEPKQKK